jgi:hypothetical protein
MASARRWSEETKAEIIAVAASLAFTAGGVNANPLRCCCDIEMSWLSAT